MRFTADLHIHSKYSRACSKDCDLEHLTWWARRKGVTLVGTGDFTHPAWFDHLRETLVPAEPGLFRLRDDLDREIARTLPPVLAAEPVRFMLSVEISTIYKRGERTRKVHHLVYVPGFEEAERFNARLGRIGNLGSDGRPILGLDSRDLLEITLESGEGSYLVPAHVWTPWFAVFGSKSGFDAIEECYVDLADHIFALETGLSSDPAMNWRVSGLDRYRLVSNSDAHSPPILGREATLFDTDLDYFAVLRALRTGEGHAGSLEFFPEEGKYHVDGHRKCDVRMEPQETRAHNGLCPECGKPLTVGVLSRVEELADRPEGFRPEGAADFRSLVPLPEIMSEILGVGPKSKRVVGEINKLTAALGPELKILQDVPVEEVETYSPQLAEALRRLRRGEVIREAGYDGEYGVIRLFEPGELARASAAATPSLFDDSLFDLPVAPAKPSPRQGRKGRAGASNDGQPAASPARDGAADDREALAVINGSDDPAVRPATQRPPASDGDQGGESRPSGHPGSSADATRRPPASGKDQDAGSRASGQPEGSLNTTRRPPTSSENQDAGSRTSGQPETSANTTRRPPTSSEDQDAEPHSSSRAGSPAVPAAATSLLDGLDPEQRAAAEITEGPLLIIAGPGTGKTRTLTHRLAHLVTAGGVPPEHCLAITFTRRAAEEMAERLAALAPAHAPRLTTATFHSLGVRILREQHERAGLGPRFGIADQAMRLAIAAEFTGDDRSARRLLTDLSNWRRTGGTPDARPDLADRYLATLRQRDLVDFDDLIALPVALLEDDPDLAAHYRDRYRWISVDEYQDVDDQQYRLLRQLAPPDGNLTAIGDPDQAIYRFRGADVGFFLRFQQDFPTARTVRLTRNYRSAAPILTAALQVISPTTLVPGRELHPMGAHPDVPVGLHRAVTEQAEASFVARTIEQLLGGASFHSFDSGRVDSDGAGGLGFSDFAVLYRTDRQARAVMAALTNAGLPFQKRSHDRLADRPGVERLLAELAYAPESGETAGVPIVKRLRVAADALLDRLPAGPADDESADDLPAQLNTALDLLKPLAERCGDDMERFRTELALGVEVDTWDPRADRISLLTLHASKGLEFPVVFLVGCEDGLLPLRPPGIRPEDLEEDHVNEERRLLFVGMTRAERHLYISHAAERVRQGAARATGRSPFLNDLDTAACQVVGEAVPRRKPREIQLRLL
ncbi:UvrD-helicase domain-containing protein [Thermopolyspora sp. NPDC052614]|uniref:UvrD-helicase domain-containing protein n=1 Tax=Thermopolyspora sp. NPDC052614 TaxID=3155682 RepID=UPI003431951F